MRLYRLHPGRPERLEQRVTCAEREDRGGAAEPHVRLRVGALGAQPVVHLLRAHVEPPHVDVGVELFEATLEQREEIAAVGAVDDERRATVALTTRREQGDHHRADEPVRNAECGMRETNAECGMRNAESEGKRRVGARPPTTTPHSAFRIPHFIACPAPGGWRRADTPPAPPPRPPPHTPPPTPRP